MCIRYNHDVGKIERWSKELGAWVLDGETAPTGDSFPGSEAPIVVADEEHGKRVALARWGLTPPWTKDPLFGKKNAYNARAETVAEKPTFRAPFRKSRCLIPAAAFYERASGRWLRVAPTGAEVFAIAGLFEPANEMSDMTTFTMVTTEPNLLIGEVHDRMPVVLAPADYEHWLDPQADGKDLLSLLTPCPEEWVSVEDAGPIGRSAPGKATGSLFEPGA